jgi:hypothetical protein
MPQVRDRERSPFHGVLGPGSIAMRPALGTHTTGADKGRAKRKEKDKI